MRLIFGHCGGAQGWIETLDLVKEYDNAWVDVCMSFNGYSHLEEAVKRLGCERVLFGTDTSFIDPAPGLGKIAFARSTKAVDSAKRSSSCGPCDSIRRLR